MLRIWTILAVVLTLFFRSGPAVGADEAATGAEIAKQTALLASVFRAADKASLGSEDATSRKYLTLLERYLPYIKSNLKPFAADAGSLYHKSDNSQEHAVRQNATVAFALATLDTYGSVRSDKAVLDPGDTARKLIRYLAITHKANLLPTGDGKFWGDHWQSALWAAFAGHAAWLEWESLDDQTRVMVARMVEHEADRFNARPPDDGEWDDTKAEENAWNAKVIVLAHCMFPNHPQSALWKERSLVYLLNAVSTASDRTSGLVVDGKPLRDRVSTTVIHDDHTLENHSRVHPDYLAGTIGLQLRNSIAYRLAGLPVPDAVLHNARPMFEVAKLLTAPNGSNLYVNGQDWWPHRHDVPLMAGGFVAPLLNDPAAAYLEQAALGTLQKMHARFRDGRAFEPREYTYPNVEEEMMARYAELYLAHRLMDYPKPLSRAEFVRQTSGTWKFDIGGFALHRTSRKAVSFAWKSPVMGLVYPGADTWFTSPDASSLLGRISVEGVKDSPPTMALPEVRLLNEGSPAGSGGFTLRGDVLRCEGAVTQQVAFISCGDDTAIYSERLVANRDLTVNSIATGSIAILNEDAKPLEDNVRRITASGGKFYVAGRSDQPESVRLLPGQYLNIEDKLSLVVAGSAGLAIRENHSYQRGRLTQEVYANYSDRPLAVKKGQVISTIALGLVTDASRSRRLEIKMRVTDGDDVAVDFGEWAAEVHFTSPDADATADDHTLKLTPGSVELRRR